MRAYSMIVGNSFLSGSGSSYAMIICELRDFHERKGREHEINSVIGRLYKATSGFNEAKIMFFTPGMVPGFGMAGGFELKLEDKTGGDIKVFEQNAATFLDELRKMPEIQYATTAFNTRFPQYQVDVNAAGANSREYRSIQYCQRCRDMWGGITLRISTGLGSSTVSAQAEPKYRGNPDDMNMCLFGLLPVKWRRSRNSYRSNESMARKTLPVQHVYLDIGEWRSQTGIQSDRPSRRSRRLPRARCRRLYVRIFRATREEIASGSKSC